MDMFDRTAKQAMFLKRGMYQNRIGKLSGMKSTDVAVRATFLLRLS
jgi:hypothetical protein